MIGECPLAARPTLRRDLRRLRRDGGDAGQIARLRERIDASRAVIASRIASRPAVSYPADLPIVAAREEIARAIDGNQVVVVCGETGSGKSTQLPKLCLDLGRGIAGQIGHTQPRRIAARSVAARIAHELGTPLGEIVGYKVRFGDRTRPETLVKVMTDGTLLAEIQRDRELRHYDTLIIDEAHERSLNVDFLLGYLTRLLPRRPELKLIITSATIDPERFSRHFGDAPIIEVSGRGYPVDVRYRPLVSEDPDVRDRDQPAAILAAVDELAAEGPGDVLVFLSGEREIREMAEALRKHHPPDTQILPLYARLSADEQQRVFEPHPGRRIVLATNVAETSLTVPGIRGVVDPGLARISRYRARTRVQQLPIEPISQASARQRSGRCGRVGPGVCIRLYSEKELEEREPFTAPEIQRTNLASVILQMKTLGLGEVRRFPFLDPPRRAAIRDGEQTLRELGATDADDRLTPLGRDLARLPIDPRIGRMVLAARGEACVTEVLVIAAALSIPDPRLRPLEHRDAADAAHRIFADPLSDFLSYLAIWRFFHETKRHATWSKVREACRASFLSFVRMREWIDVHGQLKRLTTETGVKLNRDPADPDAIHRALLAGLLRNIGVRGDGAGFTGAAGQRFSIFPGSALFAKPPRWVMAAEIVETTRRYARGVARIQPGWIERVGAHLVDRSYANPRWDPRSGQGMIFEKVSLYGLEIIAKRRVPLARVDRVAARAMFIQRGLVEGGVAPEAPFQIHNRRLRERVRLIEAKRRQRDVIVEIGRLEAFYDTRLPERVTSSRTFHAWRRKAERTDPERLFMTEGDLLRPGAPGADPAGFPDTLSIGDARYPLTYSFDPAGVADGVTVTVPLAALPTLSPDRLEWLVPGRLEEKVVAMVRGLPKTLRRHFVPVPDHAARCVEMLDFGVGSLPAAVSDTLHRQTGVAVPAEAWSMSTLPDHLRLRVRVVDENDAELAAGRDLPTLRDTLAQAAAEAIRHEADVAFDRQGLTDWDFGPLPPTIVLTSGGARLTAYPAIVDEGETVALRVMPTRAEARAATRVGLRRLYWRHCRAELEFQLDHLPQRPAIEACLDTRVDGATWCADLALVTVDRVFLDEPWPHDESSFHARLDAGWGRLGSASLAIADELLATLEAAAAVEATIATHDKPVWRATIDDVRHHLARLVPPRLLLVTPTERLPHLPRYLAALARRVERLPAGGHVRDARRRERIDPYWDNFRRAMQDGSGRVDAAALQAYRWMLEELAVSVFAQELGTAEAVSETRLAQQWELVMGRG
ncbi:MAG: ATP-dependent RNA helicase HrpA [Phycisphaerae bacterium]|nr:ATP-dependent RNA helicase HrpA [Phycisphaerae bacterium]